MSRNGETLSTTTSLCPTCLERVPGRYEARDGSVHLARTCPEHGDSSRAVWGSLDHWEWAGDLGPDPEPDGDLTVDNSHACLAVVEVTAECNLSCSYCFASSGPTGRELPFDEVVGLLDTVLDSGGPRPVQFSGGEPTVRDDLPELVERATAMGFEHVQVNTNGIVLAHEEGYAERLVEAGVTAVYLQFDGLEPETYEAIREVDLAETKRLAVEACRRADLPAVLVPTVVPGTNDHEMGDVVRFALENLDVVRSVNFQPVAHFGRYADDGGRFSLDEAATRLADQVDALDARDLLPVPCCSSYCQTATALLPDGEGGVVPLTRFIDSDTFESMSGMVDESDWMELLAGTPVGEDRSDVVAEACGIEIPGVGGCCGPEASAGGACCGPEALGGAGGLLESVLPVSFTGFMDADAADVDRLGNCCIAVPTLSGELVPFCAYNMTTEDGRYALRSRHGWGGRPAVNEPAGGPPEIETDGGGSRESPDDGRGCCAGDSCGDG